MISSSTASGPPSPLEKAKMFCRGFGATSQGLGTASRVVARRRRNSPRRFFGPFFGAAGAKKGRKEPLVAYLIATLPSRKATLSVPYHIHIATPYKMYSTLEEIDETQIDDHYSEFLGVMDFLNISEQEKNEFKTVWSDYSVKLKEITKGVTTIIEAKNAAENAMYQHICRTERISATENADIIDDSDVKLSLEVLEQDIKSYIQAQNLLDDINAPFNVPVDYIKSTPYIMSFMRDYQLKRYIEKHFTEFPNEI